MVATPSGSLCDAGPTEPTRALGNRYFAAKEFEEAARVYTQALAVAENDGLGSAGEQPEIALLLANRAAARLQSCGLAALAGKFVPLTMGALQAKRCSSPTTSRQQV